MIRWPFWRRRVAELDPNAEAEIARLKAELDEANATIVHVECPSKDECRRQKLLLQRRIEILTDIGID